MASCGEEDNQYRQLALTASVMDDCMANMLFQHKLSKKYPDLIPDKVGKQLDKVAVDFRQACIKTSQLAGLMASCWCENVLDLLENFAEIDDPAEEFQSLAKQSDDFAKGFKTIADYIRVVSASTQDALLLLPIDEKEKKLRKLETDKMNLEIEKRNAVEKLDQAKTQANVSNAAAVVSICFTWVPVVGPITLLASASAAVYNNMKAGDVADRLQEKEKDFECARSEYEKMVKVVGELNKTILLFEKLLNNLEIMATFWFDQSKDFASKAVKFAMISDANKKKAIRLAKKEVTSHKSGQQELEKYSKDVGRICYCYSYGIAGIKATTFPKIPLPEYKKDDI